MKPITYVKRLQLITSIFSIILAFNSVEAQLDWTEHLSHDRLTRNNLGFFFEDSNLILVMDNHSGPASTVEKISGNVAKDVIIEFNYNYDARSTFTGVTSKEVLLINPQDLDFYGFGAKSIRMDSEGLNIRSLESLINQPCIDALIPKSINKPSECLTGINFDHLIINNDGDIIATYESSPMTMHEGLISNYRVQNDSLFNHDDNSAFFEYEIPNFKSLYNNPYTAELVILLDSTIISYSSDSLQREEKLIGTEVISIDFTPDAMYYISKVGSGYKIYKSYYSGGSNLWMDIDQAPNGQKVEILEMSIKGIDVYLFGIHYNEVTKTKHHIVQKQNLLFPDSPPRKDLAIKSFLVNNEELDNENYEYTYEIEVINNGTSLVNTFDLYSDLKEFNELFYSDIDLTFTGNLQPNQITVLQGSFTGPAIDKININIPGADFMLDSYPNDNNASFSLISSNTDSEVSKYAVIPNPTSGIINLNIEPSSKVKISLLDIHGRLLLTPNLSSQQFDISSLPSGQYWIRIMDDEKVFTKSIIKN